MDSRPALAGGSGLAWAERLRYGLNRCRNNDCRQRVLGYNVAQELFMPANAVVRARIDARVKEEATAIYAAAGLTLSDAFRMMLMRTVAERALPFEPLMPNAETVEAMKAARRGELVTVGSIDNLLADLHADD